jgi:serine/threonine-protein kinase
VYSLGVVGYELLSGHPPFAGAAAAVAMAQVSTTPPALPTAIPTDVRDLIMRAMSKQPDSRPANGGAFRDELRILQQRVRQPDLSTVDEEAATTLIDQSVAVTTTPERSSNHDGSTVLMSAPPRIAPQLSADRARRRGRAWTFAIGAGALVVLTVLAIAAPSDELPTPPAQSTTVPPPATISIDPQAYVGSPAADARTALEAAGLSVEITRIASELPAGSIAQVDPIGPLKPGDTVVLSVSLGPTPVADTTTTQVRPGQGHGKDKK